MLSKHQPSSLNKSEQIQGQIPKFPNLNSPPKKKNFKSNQISPEILLGDGLLEDVVESHDVGEVDVHGGGLPRPHRLQLRLVERLRRIRLLEPTDPSFNKNKIK